MTIEDLESQYQEISIKIRLYKDYRSVFDVGRLLYYINARGRVLMEYERLIDALEGNSAASDPSIGSSFRPNETSE